MSHLCERLKKVKNRKSDSDDCEMCEDCGLFTCHGVCRDGHQFVAGFCVGCGQYTQSSLAR